jgi:hypothetical protein
MVRKSNPNSAVQLIALHATFGTHETATSRQSGKIRERETKQDKKKRSIFDQQYSILFWNV